MPLIEDQLRALQTRTELPPGGFPGTRLTKITAADGDCDWVSDPDSQIREGNGDPNGNVNAPKGTLYVERDAPALWQNDDGLSSWTQIGSGGGGSFPISYDDGTYTYEITAVGGLMRISVTEDADPTNIVTFDLLPPQASISVVNAFDLIATDPSSVINIHATDAGSLISIEAGDVVEINTGGTDGDVSIGNPNNKTTDLVSERVRFFQNAVPADGVMSNSSFAFSLDDTPGATTLKIKAKDSGGTVRTATIPLT